MTLVPATSVGSSGGAFSQISDQLLGGAVATIDFSGIPATSNHLCLVFFGRQTGAAGNRMALRINADASAVYESSFDATTGQTSGHLQTITDAGAGGGRTTACVVWVPNYLSTAAVGKNMIAYGAGADSGAFIGAVGAALWGTTGVAVTQLTLLLTGAGNYTAGSRATLYGVL